MKEEFWERPLATLCNYWWLLLAVLVLVIAGYFTRDFWMPVLGFASTADELGININIEDELPELEALAEVSPPAAETPVPEPTATMPLPTHTPGITQEPTEAILSAPQVGAFAPDFSLLDLNNQSVSLSDYQGEPVLLVFFATWCPHCQVESALLETVYQKYQDQGLQVIAVNITFNDTRADILPFANSAGWEFSPLLDEEGNVINLYNQDGVPGHIFIDKEGIIRSIVEGKMDEDGFDQEISKIL